MAIFTALGEIWTAILTWIVSAISALVEVFYTAEGGFTLLGTFAAIGVGIGIIWLVIGVIQNFIRLRS